ncbi:MAG: type II secretion system protein [Aquificaceae bacterium]|jgi:hypothetical protein|uniref:PulJ/GspJ family protein n=1 Tax=Hydrogenobacter sp. Uz 6-8 TaxID=3384828 RepID=UPI0030AF7B54
MRGYTLIEILVAFSIAIIAIPVIYQTLSTLSSRLYYLDKISREIDYLQRYNNSVVGELTNQSSIIRSFYFELESIKGECEEKGSEERYISCPYKDFSPLNPYLDTPVDGVRVIVFSSGFYFLIPK